MSTILVRERTRKIPQEPGPGTVNQDRTL